jgi:hypothetical protein
MKDNPIGPLDVPLADDQASYVIHLYTKEEDNAGTDAGVYISLIGEEAVTQPHALAGSHLRPSQGPNPVRHEFSDVSIVATRVRIGHDNRGSRPGWLLDKVVVWNVTTNKSWEFPCGIWLATDEGDGKTERILDYSGPVGLQKR